MRGLDLSHYNRVIDWGSVDVPFIIFKATESTSYIDPTYLRYREQARKRGILTGAYHFARGTDAKKEAAHFVKTIGLLEKGELVALDWEIQHPTPAKWCLEWLRAVEKALGFKPMIYMNASTEAKQDWSPVVMNNNGLWLARYYLNTGYQWPIKPKPKQWPFFALWQFSSRGKQAGIIGNVDTNYTSMTIERLKLYGAK